MIADRKLTLGDLIGTISTFFKRIGITDVKFKPAYNPYTEPSMEIFGFSPQLNKWSEWETLIREGERCCAMHLDQIRHVRQWLQTKPH